MKKIIAFIAVLLCLVTVLSSCWLSSLRILDRNACADDFVPTTATLLGFGGLPSYQRGNLIKTTHTDKDQVNTYVIYNLSTDQMLLEVADTETETVAVVLGGGSDDEFGWFYVEKTAKNTEDENADVDKSIVLYDENGNEIAAASGKRASLQTAADLILIDEKLYRAEKKKIEYVLDWKSTAELPRGLWKADGCYAEFAEDVVVFYDSKLNVRGTYSYPMDKITADASIVMDNGSMLFQYVEKLPDSAEEWSYIENGEKFEIVSTLLDVKNAKKKALKLDFLMCDEGASYSYEPDDWEEYGISKRVKNIAFAQLVEDGRLSPEKTMIELGNNGKMKGKLELIEGMAPKGLTAVAEDRWVAKSKLGSYYVINAMGKTIGGLSEEDDAAYFNRLGFLHDGRIYNWDIEPVYDLEEHEMSIVSTLKHGYILSDTDGKNYYLGSDHTAKELNGSLVTGSKRQDVFVTKKEAGENTEWRVYNSNGDSILYVEDAKSMKIAATLDDVILLHFQVEDSSYSFRDDYYRLTV